MVLEGYLYVGTSLRSLHMFSAFGTRAVFSMDACLLSLSSVYAGHYPLERWCDWRCGDQNLHWILSRVSSLLCDCHCPVKGSLLPTCWDGSPQIHFWAEVWGRCDWNSPTGEEPLSIPLPELFTKCALLCHLSPAVVGPALNPTSIMGMPEISPRVPPLKSGPKTTVFIWPTVEALEAAQILAWPGLHKHAPTKSTAAKTRPISAVVASSVHSDVLPVLNLQRGQWKYKSTAYAAVGRDFSAAS